ncbi:predicted protein [Nematostella vectensis]|uniref:Uncharacterized protein n=1 Tax=Nematostella vectensis TaxID=45351 RepID=A7S2G5_NEMVE|nr:predicted protein [Nematostella vectensis]|eukprot:XP_001634165.1 predicted protein [Nematostella vectensis]
MINLVSDASRNEKRLLEKLLTGYDRNERPVLNDNESVTVTLGLTLNQIVDVDEKNQLLTTSTWIRQIWYNPLLTWNVTEYGGLKTINVSPTIIWLPDIVLYDNNCPIDVKHFPFDTQYCPLKFGSWTYDGFRLDVVNESSAADLGKYIPSAEWNLQSAESKRNVLKYFCCDEPYPDVTFTFVIRRRSLFYMMNLILPLVTITALVNVSFVLPAESGERTSLSITILLAMTVFMLVVAETIPPTSDAIPLIAKFYMAGMIEMAVALVWTCYILKYYHSDCMEMPHWVRKYILGYLGNFFGIRMENLKRYSEHSKIMRAHGENIDVVFRPESTKDLLRDEHLQEQLIPKVIDGGEEHPALALGEKILQKVETLVENSIVDDKVNIHKEEWRIAAMVMDKVSLWVFSITVLVTVLACFLQAPEYVA